MTPSASFLLQAHQQTPSSLSSKLTEVRSSIPTLPLNTNGKLFSDIGQMSNTANRVPMNQMKASTSWNFSQPQQKTHSNTNSLLSFNVSSANESSDKDKTVALSAQEINDFLS